MYIDTKEDEGGIFYGGAGNDTFMSSLYNDYMFGGGGNDTFIIDSIASANVYDGGEGYDVIHVTGIHPYQNFQAIEILSISGVDEIKSSISNADTFIYVGTRLPKLSNNPTGGSELDTHYLNLSNVKLTNIDGIAAQGTMTRSLRAMAMMS